MIVSLASDMCAQFMRSSTCTGVYKSDADIVSAVSVFVHLYPLNPQIRVYVLPQVFVTATVNASLKG